MPITMRQPEGWRQDLSNRDGRPISATIGRYLAHG